MTHGIQLTHTHILRLSSFRALTVISGVCHHVKSVMENAQHFGELEMADIFSLADLAAFNWLLAHISSIHYSCVLILSLYSILVMLTAFMIIFWRISILFHTQKVKKYSFTINPLLSFFYHTFLFCSNPLVELDVVCVPCRWDLKCHKNLIGMWEERNLLNCKFRWIERSIGIVNDTKYCMINWHLDT